MTNFVTIWSTVTNAIATRRTITGWTEPEGDGGAEPIYSDPIPLERLTDSTWRRPEWSDAQRADPASHGGANFEAGECILDVVDVKPSLGEYDRLGAMGDGVPDLESGTMTYTWAKVSADPFDADTHHAPVWNGSSWDAPVAMTLAARKAEIKTASTAKFRKVIAAGKVINGVTIDLTSEGFERLGQAHAALAAGSGAINALTVRGGRIDLPDAASAAAVISIARDHYLAAAKTERDLYDAADDVADDADPATGDAALDLIDIEAGTVDGAGGWPA